MINTRIFDQFEDCVKSSMICMAKNQTSEDERSKAHIRATAREVLANLGLLQHNPEPD